MVVVVAALVVGGTVVAAEGDDGVTVGESLWAQLEANRQITSRPIGEEERRFTR